MYHRISFGLALRLSVRQFQMILEVLSFVKTLAAFGIITATDSPIQNIVRISFLRGYFKLKTLETMLIYARQFF